LGPNKRNNPFNVVVDYRAICSHRLGARASRSRSSKSDAILVLERFSFAGTRDPLAKVDDHEEDFHS